MIELWDLYDKDKNLLGKLHERGKKISEGEYHLVSQIWIINSKGEVLISKRHPDKIFGNLWEICVGSVIASEDSEVGAVRELYEELGIKIREYELNFLGSAIRNDWICDTYMIKKDITLDKLKLQAEEVVDAKWITIEEFEKMYYSNLLSPNTMYTFDIYKEYLK